MMTIYTIILLAIILHKINITYDDILEKQRETIYRRRNNALRHDRLKPDIDNAIFNSIHHLSNQDQPLFFPPISG